jgi:hypothetical protein
VVCAALAGACGRQNFNENNDGGGDDAGSGSSGERPNWVFVSQNLFTGGLGGIDGADQRCHDEAVDAGLDGHFIALLSDGTTSAFSRLEGSRGWLRRDGKPVADRPSQLMNFAGWYPISTNAEGESVLSSRIETWTGMRSDGTPVPNGTCSAWSSPVNSTSGGKGSLSSGGARGIDESTNPCDALNHLYCFETGHDVQVAAPTPVVGRLAFITRGTWAPSGGIGNADTFCQNDANAANLSGRTFLAALPATAASMQSRFALTGAPWVRADGVPITESASQMFTTQFASTHLSMNVDGTVTKLTQVFGGGSDHPATMSCNDWTSASGGITGFSDNEDDVGIVNRFGDNVATCNSAAALLCLEQ